MHVTIQTELNDRIFYTYTFANRDNPTTNKIDIYLKGYNERPTADAPVIAAWDAASPVCLNSKKFEDIVIPDWLLESARQKFTQAFSFADLP